MKEKEIFLSGLVISNAGSYNWHLNTFNFLYKM